MSKFTRILAIVAVAGLIASPAQADDFEKGYFTQTAIIKITGSRCNTSIARNLDMSIQFDTLIEVGFGDVIDTGPNFGIWASPIFHFGQQIDGAGGAFIAATPFTNLTMDLGNDLFFAMEDAMADYVEDNCKFPDGLNDGTILSKFQTKVSKNEERAKVVFSALGTYFDDEEEKDRKVKLIVKSGTMNED